MLADIKGVVGPTEEELQEDGDKGDGLESRSKDLRAERVRICPTSHPPARRNRLACAGSTGHQELQPMKLVQFSAYLTDPKEICPAQHQRRQSIWL